MKTSVNVDICWLCLVGFLKNILSLIGNIWWKNLKKTRLKSKQKKTEKRRDAVKSWRWQEMKKTEYEMHWLNGGWHSLVGFVRVVQGFYRWRPPFHNFTARIIIYLVAHNENMCYNCRNQHNDDHERNLALYQNVPRSFIWGRLCRQLRNFSG